MQQQPSDRKYYSYLQGNEGTPGFQKENIPIYDFQYENINFKAREEEYNNYIAKLNKAYSEIDAKLKETVRELEFQKSQNDNIKLNVNTDMRGLLVAYTDMKDKAARLEIENKDIYSKLKKRDEEVLILTSESDKLKRRLNETSELKSRTENIAITESSEMQKMIQDQKDELGDLRRKLNLALDQRRRLEQEIDQLKFNQDNMRTKFENDIKEKDLRVNQTLRSVDNEVETRTKELTIQLAAYDKLQHDNIVLDKKNKELVNEIALHINAQKLLNQELDHKQREIESLRRELEVFKGPRKNPVMCNYQGTASLNAVKIANKRFQRQIKEYLFIIWRLRYELQNEQKFRLKDQAAMAVHEGNRNPEESVYGKGRKTQKREVRYDFDVDHGVSVASSLADGVLRTLKYMREQANSMIFEIFQRSATNAEKKKTNSIILFGINLKEIDDNAWKSLTLLLDSYIFLRQLLKQFHPKFLKIKKPTGTGILEKKLQFSLGKMSFQTGTIKDRDQANRFIENSLVYIVNKKKNDTDPNKDFMFLFRILAIKYRILNPMHGGPLQIEEDLLSYMDHKVLSSCHKVLKSRPKEHQPLFDPSVLDDPENEYDDN